MKTRGLAFSQQLIRGRLGSCGICLCLLGLSCREEKQAAQQNVAIQAAVQVPPVVDPHPVQLRVEDWTLRRQNWFVDGLLLSENSDVQVSAKLMGSASLGLVIEGGAHGYYGTVLEMRIHRADDPSPSHAEVSGSWYTDVGPPFGGAIEILDGEVVLNTLAWQVGSSVQVLFELHGSQGQEPWCAHGQVRADVEAE